MFKLKYLTGQSRHYGISRGTPGSAGWDLVADIMIDELTIMPDCVVLVPTGISIELPPGHCAMIFPRSGLGHKNGLVLGNGTGIIDNDYRGEIKVSLWNRSNQHQTITRGQRIAQMVIVPVFDHPFEVVSSLSDTERQDGGFGHTGS